MAGYGMNIQMLNKLLTAFALLLIIGVLAWCAMDLKMRTKTLQHENNILKLRIARTDRAMPWIKVLNESLTELEKNELDLKAEQLRQKK